MVAKAKPHVVALHPWTPTSRSVYPSSPHQFNGTSTDETSRSARLRRRAATPLAAPLNLAAKRLVRPVARAAPNK